MGLFHRLTEHAGSLLTAACQLSTVLGLAWLSGCVHQPRLTAAQAIAQTPTSLTRSRAPATSPLRDQIHQALQSVSDTTSLLETSPLPPPTAQFPGADAILKGFDIAPTPHTWSPGDKVLIGLSFDKSTGSTDRMLLVELLDAPGKNSYYDVTISVYDESLEVSSPTWATRLRVYDSQGTLLSDKQGQLAELFMQYGPSEVARLGGGYGITANAPRDRHAKNPHPEYDFESLKPSVYGLMSLLAFGDGAGKNPVLESLISKAFTSRQLLGLVFSMGRFKIHIGDSQPLTSEEQLASLAAVSPALHEAYLADIIISVGKHETLAGRATLVANQSPLGLCGGILEGQLINLDDPSIHARFMLLAAQHGTIRPNTNQSTNTSSQ